MKVIKWIQNVAAAAAFIVALNLVDGLGVSIKDACTDELWKRKKGGMSDGRRKNDA